MAVKYPQWQLNKSAISKEACEAIIMMCKQFNQEDATVFSGREVQDSIRKSKVAWVPRNNSTEFIYQIVQKYLYDANMVFNMTVNKIPSIQFTQYNGSDEAFYNYHMDTNMTDDSDRHRKISIVIQLSDPKDYEGGDFNFRYLENPNKEDLKAQGSILTFISYHDHRVIPVTSGTRYSLVCWQEGPRFR